MLKHTPFTRHETIRYIEENVRKYIHEINRKEPLRMNTTYQASGS